MFWICCHGQRCYSRAKSYDFYQRLIKILHSIAAINRYLEIGTSCTDLRITEADLGLVFVFYNLEMVFQSKFKSILFNYKTLYYQYYRILSIKSFLSLATVYPAFQTFEFKNILWKVLNSKTEVILEKTVGLNPKKVFSRLRTYFMDEWEEDYIPSLIARGS